MSRALSAATLEAEETDMACVVWLVVWLIAGTPNLEWFESWNDWAVALLGCIVFNLVSGRAAAKHA
jgi:hypothetical protein